MEATQIDTVPKHWRSLILTAWAPYGARGSTLGSVFSVIVGQEGSQHDRFLVRRLLEEADPALLFSAIRRSGMGYGSLASVADAVGASSSDNVDLIKERALRHGNADIRAMALSPGLR